MDCYNNPKTHLVKKIWAKIFDQFFAKSSYDIKVANCSVILSSSKDGFSINIRCYPGNLDKITQLFLEKLFESKSYFNESEFENLKKEKEKSLKNISKQNSLVICEELIEELLSEK
jgi:secreted Zn-dependent insulinase-like peptidase